MSLYNMLFGKNPASDILLAMLGLSQGDCGRFRDCYLEDNGKVICVFTRNGGGNRETYMPDFSNHPQFIRDQDDDFDCTYATIRFKTPEQYLETTAKIADATDTTPPMEKFTKLLSDMANDKDNAVVSRAKEVGEKIFAALAGGETTSEGSIEITSHNPPTP